MPARYETLVKLVKPHVAMITRVALVHLEHFPSIEAIADASRKFSLGSSKAESPFSIAMMKCSIGSPRSLTPRGWSISSLRHDERAQSRLLSYETVDDLGVVEADVFGRRLSYRIGAPGRHFALNSLAVLVLAHVFDLDLQDAAQSLADFGAPKGRGQREKLSAFGGDITLIDESYNANPTSVRAALELLAATSPGRGGRRIAVLGDMLELGPRAGELHAELAQDLVRSDVDLLFTAGPMMSQLFYASPEQMRGAHRSTAQELENVAIGALKPGDVVMVKGSNGSRMMRIVAAMKEKYSSAPVAVSSGTVNADAARGLFTSVRSAQSLPLHHLPRRRRGGDSAVLCLLLRAEHHRGLENRARERPADSRRRSGVALLTKKGTPTMGG